MDLPPPFVQRYEALFDLCEKFGVKKLYVFGSAAKNQFNPKKLFDRAAADRGAIQFFTTLLTHL